MKKALAALSIFLLTSCSPDTPAEKPSCRAGKTDGEKTEIIIEVDTTRTEYEFELKM